MEQFSLEKYLANPSRKVVTRDGHSVRIICTDHDNISYPIIGAIKGYKFPFCFSEDGYVVDSKCNNANDLFFAPEKYTGWINVYRNSDTGHTYAGAVYDSKEDTEKRKIIDENYVTTIKIEWEE